MVGFDKRRSLEVARRRHLMITERLDVHKVCGKEELEDIFCELSEATPSKKHPGKVINVRYKVLSRTLVNMNRRGDIRIHGTVPGDVGSPPRNMYGIEPVHPQLLVHEWMMTRYWKALGWPSGVARLSDVEDVPVARNGSVSYRIRPDAARVFPNGKIRWYELDRATEGRAEIDRKVEAYADKKRAVLFITVSDVRLQKLRRWTEALRGFAFFSVWNALVRDPRGPQWIDHAGNRVSLET